MTVTTICPTHAAARRPKETTGFTKSSAIMKDTTHRYLWLASFYFIIQKLFLLLGILLNTERTIVAACQRP
jgi:hypothetical protein